MIEALGAFAVPAEVTVSTRPLSPDPNDDMVLNVAVNGREDVLVMNNKNNFAGALLSDFLAFGLSTIRFRLPVRRSPMASCDECWKT